MGCLSKSGPWYPSVSGLNAICVTFHSFVEDGHQHKVLPSGGPYDRRSSYGPLVEEIPLADVGEALYSARPDLV